MANYLLIDYGASRIKVALLDAATGDLSNKKDFEPLPNQAKESGHYEVSLSGITKQFLRICKLYFKIKKFTGILISSEMHGFALLDENNKPLTDYVSWKDERSLDGTFDELVSELGSEFREITGMKPRPSLPFFNAIHLAKKRRIEMARMITLPDWLTMCSGQSNNLGHDTMIAGLGVYDIENRKVSDRLLSIMLEKSGCKFRINQVAETGSVAGYWNEAAEMVPIYAGVGDHQCAILGAGNLLSETLSINIGTGSQVSTITGVYEVSDDFDVRPFFDNVYLKTITHIPAGRVLNAHLNFLNSVGKRNYWNELHKLTAKDLENADLNFDLALFKSAWNYSDGGKITGITESNLNLKNYLASIVKAMAESYLKASSIVDPNSKLKRVIMSGGVPAKIPALVAKIKTSGGRKTEIKKNIDETLVGLSAVARKL